jgi:hypothetical protein
VLKIPFPTVKRNKKGKHKTVTPKQIMNHYRQIPYLSSLKLQQKQRKRLCGGGKIKTGTTIQSPTIRPITSFFAPKSVAA